jgi:hypothetical protein
MDSLPSIRKALVAQGATTFQQGSEEFGGAMGKPRTWASGAVAAPCPSGKSWLESVGVLLLLQKMRLMSLLSLILPFTTAL